MFSWPTKIEKAFKNTVGRADLLVVSVHFLQCLSSLGEKIKPVSIRDLLLYFICSHETKLTLFNRVPGNDWGTPGACAVSYRGCSMTVPFWPANSQLSLPLHVSGFTLFWSWLFRKEYKTILFLLYAKAIQWIIHVGESRGCCPELSSTWRHSVHAVKIVRKWLQHYCSFRIPYKSATPAA